MSTLKDFRMTDSVTYKQNLNKFAADIKLEINA